MAYRSVQKGYLQDHNNVVVRPACFAGQWLEPVFCPSDDERLTLDRMRWLAIRARLRAGEDMEKACYLLSSCDNVTFERCGLLFFSALQRHSRHNLSMHKPAARSLTRDEIWLLRLLKAHEDRALFSRMIAWHVEPCAQRWMRFLGQQLAQSVHAV